MSDLFDTNGNTAKQAPVAAPTPPAPSPSSDDSYSAASIEVLEGLESVRKRPGMYIGNTDSDGLHHLVAEILDNSMDEAVAGHATTIWLSIGADQSITIMDNGRGIPVDPHPRFPDKSALEVILTTLHAGGKFSQKAYQTSGGLHGVGISVVNALSEALDVEVYRDGATYQQRYAYGKPLGGIEQLEGKPPVKHGTKVTFRADTGIFHGLQFQPARLYRMARAKAYLYKNVTIQWQCAAELLEGLQTPPKDKFHFPNGLADYLDSFVQKDAMIVPAQFAGENADPPYRVEWALAWSLRSSNTPPIQEFYCNTIPTPQGGTHEAGLKRTLFKSIKEYCDRINFKKADQILADDVMSDLVLVLSVFLPEPQFQGQTKDKLANKEAGKIVEQAIKDRFDLWLTQDPSRSDALMAHFVEVAEARKRMKQQQVTTRKSPTRRLQLPGKLADCSNKEAAGTELFIVEGDSAGGSAKQARRRETQAILPLRGKILNVASATKDKIQANQELKDLVQAMGCGYGRDFDLEKLRYEKIIIMTDADVDGAHIAALLMTFFYQEMRALIEAGHLFLAAPPLFRLSHGNKSVYAIDEAQREEFLATTFKNVKNVEISRFKGLGEMRPAQLKETTMNPDTRRLIQVRIPDLQSFETQTERQELTQFIEQLMGRKAEYRTQFIQENASFVEDLDI